MSSIRKAGAIAAFIVSAQASAAPGVSIYGNLDLGIVKQSGSSAGVERGYNNWIGVKGEEDLGGGLSAIFNLQARFNADTGQQERASTFWQGESTVGLRSAAAGTLRLGRALSPLWQNVWAFEPWLNSGFNASLSAYQTGSYSSDGVSDEALGYANFSRIANGVFYTSPDVHGLTLDLAGSIERPENGDARVLSTSLNFSRGPLSAMLSVERNARKDRIAFLGASYRLGHATLMSSYGQSKLAKTGTERTYVVAGTYVMGANTVRVGYGRNISRNQDKTSMGIVHALSARTSLYADIYRERADGNANGTAAGISHSF